LQDLDQQHNQKLLSEYEKYQELQRKTQSMQEDYERQLAEMERAKAQVRRVDFWSIFCLITTSIYLFVRVP
jgi:hypothetical protein